MAIIVISDSREQRLLSGVRQKFPKGVKNQNEVEPRKTKVYQNQGRDDKYSRFAAKLSKLFLFLHDGRILENSKNKRTSRETWFVE